MPPMIPMKHSTIFKSRWWALIWAAGIIWFAVDTIGGGDAPSDNQVANAEVQTDAMGQPIDQAQADALLNQAIAVN